MTRALCEWRGSQRYRVVWTCSQVLVYYEYWLIVLNSNDGQRLGGTRLLYICIALF